MFNVNVDNVLYGNPFKKLDIMYSDVISKNDDESAKSYYDYYSTLPLSVILPASELIFRESRYGIKYFTDIISEEFVPYYIYAEQYKKLQDFVNSVSDFSEEEKRDYDAALNILKSKIDATKKAMAPFSIELTGTLIRSNNSRSYDIDLMDMLHNTRYESFDDEFEFDGKLLDTIEVITSTRIGFILYAPDIFRRVPLDAFAMERLRECFKSDCECYADFTNTAYSVILLRLMNQDPMYRELISCNRNKCFRDSLNEWLSVNPKDLIDNVLCKPCDKDAKLASDIENRSSDVLEAVFDMINSVDVMESDNPLRNERLGVKKCIYEYYAECLSTILTHGHDFSLIGESVFGECGSILDELAKCDLYSERCSDELGEESCKNSMFTDEECDIACKEIRDYFESMDVEEDDDEDEDSSKSPSDNPEKDQKFKSRLTNKALDVDKKAREIEAKMDERTTATKKLGKSFMAVPNHIRKNIDDAVASARDSKKNKLKRKILNDGYRSRWWRKITTATKYGMIASVNLLLVPMYWLLRRSEKTKNKLLKQDLIKDFELELSILKDQYEDASREYNGKEKERIRREIDKMERELKRVKYNVRALN